MLSRRKLFKALTVLIVGMLISIIVVKVYPMYHPTLTSTSTSTSIVSRDVGRTRHEEIQNERCPHTTYPLLSVFIGLKTTSNNKRFVTRVQQALDTWGRNALGNMALITDGVDRKANEDIMLRYTSLPVIEIAGSEKYGYYKTSPADFAEGYRSQRIKVKSFIHWFRHNVRADSAIKWLCYIDDDMYVNVHNLNEELAGILAHPPPTCSRMDRCVVGNVASFPVHGRMSQFTSAVWCMTIPTVEAVDSLLQSGNDQSIGFTGTDDVGFFRMLRRRLNIQLTDSVNMLSIVNRLSVSPSQQLHNPLGAYQLHKTHNNKSSSGYKAASDVLARLSVLDISHVNCSDLCLRPGHSDACPCKDSQQVISVSQWHEYVNPTPTCRQNLNLSLQLSNSSSYILGI